MIRISISDFEFLTMAKQNITPLFDNVLIKPIWQPEAKTSGGIYLPETEKEKPEIGEIMAVGKGAFNEEGKLIPMIIKVGQKVLYRKGYDTTKATSDGWIIVKSKDILAIIE